MSASWTRKRSSATRLRRRLRPPDAPAAPGAATADMEPSVRRILLGRVHGAFGVRGELKLESFTDPANAIFRYQPWVLRDAQGRERERAGARGRLARKSVVEGRGVYGRVDLGGGRTLKKNN